MEELPIEVGVGPSQSRGSAVSFGRRPSGPFVGVALLVVVVLAVVLGSSRSSGRPASSTTVPPSSTPVVAPTVSAPITSTAAASSTTVPAAVTTLPPEPVAADPTLDGYELVMLRSDGSAFAVDMATGGLPRLLGQTAAAPSHTAAITSSAFLVEGNGDNPILAAVDFEGNTEVLGTASYVVAAADLILLADADVMQPVALFDARGRAKGTLAPTRASSRSDLALSGNSVIETGGGKIYAVPVSTGAPRVVAAGDLIDAGGGQVAYVTCNASFECGLRFRSIAGGPEVTSEFYEAQMSWLGFTADGSLWVAWMSQGSQLRLIAVETRTGRVHVVDDTVQSMYPGGPAGPHLTADGRYVVERSSDRTSLNYLELPDGRHAGTIKIPDSIAMQAVMLVPTK